MLLDCGSKAVSREVDVWSANSHFGESIILHFARARKHSQCSDTMQSAGSLDGKSLSFPLKPLNIRVQDLLPFRFRICTSLSPKVHRLQLQTGSCIICFPCSGPLAFWIEQSQRTLYYVDGCHGIFRPLRSCMSIC